MLKKESKKQIQEIKMFFKISILNQTNMKQSKQNKLQEKSLNGQRIAQPNISGLISHLPKLIIQQ